MKLSKYNILIIGFFCFLAVVLSTGKAKAYYGYGGLYGGFYGGMYGGSSLYGMYGLGGMYGMYGMYGGLMGMYGGMMGMYGGMMGGLYGGMGLYGSGMYGGLTSPFGLQNMYYSVNTGSGLNYQVPFLQIAPVLGMAGLYNSLFPNLFGSVSPSVGASVAAEQAGFWQGLWSNNIYSGPMTLNLVEDPLTLALSGSAQLLTNYSLGLNILVAGTALNGQVIVSGTGIGLGSQIFELQIVGLLTSATTMNGTYTIINTSNGVPVENGTINLVLATPVI